MASLTLPFSSFLFVAFSVSALSGVASPLQRLAADHAQPPSRLQLSLALIGDGGGAQLTQRLQKG
jgi:hypothetical protein